MGHNKKTYLINAAFFIAGLLAAAIATWFVSAPDTTVSGERQIIPAAETSAFLDTLGNRDFTAIREAGSRLFREGATVAEADALLSPYAVNGFPPHSVYMLFARNAPDASQRILLTLDESGSVISFMAEETVVTE